MPDFVYMIETRLSPEQQSAIKLVQQIARDRHMNVYLTGGAVRDFFTGAPVRDLDFSVQGNALNLLKDLEKAGAQIQGSNEQLQVLHVLLPGRVRAEISSTRTERYEKPSKPEVHPATMVEDLRRRDFTANAMALSLNPGSFALFMDPLNGVADIEARLLRVVHNYGFYEEPSRMIRAVRFMSRFGWTMEERTQTRFQSAKENDYIANISKAALGYELEQIMHEPDPLAAMRALEGESYLKLLYPGWSSAKVDEAGIQRIAELRDKLASLGLSADPSMAYAEYLIKKMPEKDVLAMQKMMPLKGFVEAWRKQEDEAKELAKRLTGKEAERPSLTWKLLMSVKPETVLYLALTNKNQAVEKKLEDFFQNWPQFRQKMPYAIMTELRIVPELPVYQRLLDEMFLLMIDGKLQTEEEIRAFLQPHSPPLPVAPPSLGRRGRAKKSVKPAKAAKVGKPAEAQAPKPEGQPPVLEAVAVAAGKAIGTVQKAITSVLGGAAAKSAAAKTAPLAKSRKVDMAAKLKRKPAVAKIKTKANKKTTAKAAVKVKAKSKAPAGKPKKKAAPKPPAKKAAAKKSSKQAAKKAPAKKSVKRR